MITSGMLTYARQSHSRYQECLKQKRERAINEEEKGCWENQSIGKEKI